MRVVRFRCAIVALLLNEVLELAAPVHLVLDDVHRAAAADGVHEVLDALIEGAPHNLRLYMLLREPLPIRMSRLQSQRRAALLRADDLAFTEDEIATLFQDVWNCPLDKQAVAQLSAKSGGWITALVLVHLALERLTPAAIRAFVDNLHESSDVIFSSYRGDSKYPDSPHVQSFLKETSILQQFDAEVADWLTSAGNASHVIADIDRRRLFLSRGRSAEHVPLSPPLRIVSARNVGAGGRRRRLASTSTARQ